MTLSASTLASGLEALTPTTSEATAISRFVDAWDDYFAGATVSGVSVTPGSYSAGLSAMSAAMVGMTATNAGATSIQAGVTAFWTAILALPTSLWITAPIVLVPPIVPPPGLATVAAGLTAVFGSNLAGELNLADACSAVATSLHGTAGLGALVPGSVPPAPPVPLPIL